MKDSAATALLDGNWGFGQVAAKQATEIAIDKAGCYGISGVGMLHCGHVGRIGEYAEMATGQNMIGLVFTSAGPAGGLMVPYGGAQRVLGTNPIAAAMPAGKHPVFLMDFATSMVAAGRLELAPDKDAQIPDTWAVDSEGYPATTPRQFLEGGGLLPFGRHKGYALALLVELLGGALTGAGCSERPFSLPEVGVGGNAGLVLVIDIGHFTEVDAFYVATESFFDRLKRVKRAPGFDEIVIPGEPEAANREVAYREGITIDDTNWGKIQAAALECGVKLES